MLKGLNKIWIQKCYKCQRLKFTSIFGSTPRLHCNCKLAYGEGSGDVLVSEFKL